METSTSIANFFIKKSNEEGTPFSPMKIIKLTYIAYGWYGALFDKKMLFEEDVQAWKYGPVIPSLYHNLKHFRNNGVDELIVTIDLDSGEDGYKISEPLPKGQEKMEFLEKIWETYAGFTAVQLSWLTHQEGTPWEVAWNKLGGKDKEGFVIPFSLIAKYYLRKADGE